MRSFLHLYRPPSHRSLLPSASVLELDLPHSPEPEISHDPTDYRVLTSSTPITLVTDPDATGQKYGRGGTQVHELAADRVSTSRNTAHLTTPILPRVKNLRNDVVVANRFTRMMVLKTLRIGVGIPSLPHHALSPLLISKGTNTVTVSRHLAPSGSVKFLVCTLDKIPSR
jgi:hypothetical protein